MEQVTTSGLDIAKHVFQVHRIDAAAKVLIRLKLRRGDVHSFGRQHIKDGVYTIRTSKTGEIVSSTVLPALRAAIDATDCGPLTFLVTAHGAPFKSKASFGNWFGKACRAAGVSGSAHGIRKAVAAQTAEGGASEAKMNSFFGWAHDSRESAAHVQKVNRAKMAKDVAKILARTMRKGAGGATVKQLKRKGK